MSCNRREKMAISNASVTSPAVIEEALRQPTIIREYTAVTRRQSGFWVLERQD
jgi:hypothetical protein